VVACEKELYTWNICLGESGAVCKILHEQTLKISAFLPGLINSLLLAEVAGKEIPDMPYCQM